MDADNVKALIENALADYFGEPISPELIEEMHKHAVSVLPNNKTVGYFRSFFKDIPSFWDDDHPAYVEPAEKFETAHVEFLYGGDGDSGGSINFRFCIRLDHN